MTPEQELEFNKLKQRVAELENRQSVENIENIDNQLILNTAEVTSANVVQTYTDTNGDDVDALAIPDGWLQRRWKGKVFLVPYYTLDKK